MTLEDTDRMLVPDPRSCQTVVKFCVLQDVGRGCFVGRNAVQTQLIRRVGDQILP
jgi:hypothetical protein